MTGDPQQERSRMKSSVAQEEKSEFAAPSKAQIKPDLTPERAANKKDRKVISMSNE